MAGHADHRERVKMRVKDRERLRELIKAEELIEMLGQVALGMIMADPAQITAARALLAKVLPDLASVEATVDPEMFEVGAEPMTAEAWAAKHGATTVGTVQ